MWEVDYLLLITCKPMYRNLYRLRILIRIFQEYAIFHHMKIMLFFAGRNTKVMILTRSTTTCRRHDKGPFGVLHLSISQRMFSKNSQLRTNTIVSIRPSRAWPTQLKLWVQKLDTCCHVLLYSESG